MINQIIPKITDTVNYKTESPVVFYLNVYSYLIIRKHTDIIKSADYFTLDGILLVLFLKVFANKRIMRKSPDFSSYFKELFSFLNLSGKKVYFLGGGLNEIQKFVDIISKEYPKIVISGYNDGYYSVEKETLIFNAIISEKVDVIIVGLGTPKQENFILKAREEGFNGACFTCGAFFSQTASKGQEYYPNFINKFHARWLYRIYKEPKLLKRYCFFYPKGLFYLLVDKLSVKF